MPLFICVAVEVEMMDLSSFELSELDERGDSRGEETSAGDRMAGHDDGPIADAAVDPVRRDREFARKLRHRQTAGDRAWVRQPGCP